MLDVFALQLPFSVSLVWCVLALLKRRKTHSDALLVVIMALFAAYYICDANHLAAYPDYNRLVVLDIIAQLALLAVFPLACIYIRSQFEDNPESAAAYLLLLPAVLLCVSVIVFVSILGFETCSELIRLSDAGILSVDMLGIFERFYYILTHNVFKVLFVISILASLAYFFSHLFIGRFKFGHIFTFLRGRKSSFVSNILCVFFIILSVLMILRFFLNVQWLAANPGWTSVLSVLTAFVMFFIGYIAAVPALPGGYVNIDRLKSPFEAMKQSRQEYLAGIDSGPVAGKQLTGYDKLMDSFKDLMIVQKGYLNPSMTIDEISRQLNSNRTYVSKLVNIYYGMPFRDYLNKLRIDYAKQLMTDEPDAVIDYISVKSGFQSSTQFIRKFKELEGITPTAWKSSLRQKK